MRKLPKSITKDLLEKLYLEENRSCLQIGKLISKSARQVSRYLQRFGIKTRPFSTKGLQTRLGVVLSEETKEKIRKGHLGKKLSEQHREKIRKWMLGNNPFSGKHHSEESKQKQRLKMAGRKLKPEHKAKIVKNLIPEDVKGEKSHGWKGGISSINARIRSSKRFRQWRKRVIERDGYMCIIGGKSHGTEIHADHIKSFAYYPRLRFSVGNGRTLCVRCHRNTLNYGNRKIKHQNATSTKEL